MNKTIGIKLADGSFYPILEEDRPGKKILDLTTVKDNQTTVQVDLYRSETQSMNDAEYVDTLQIDNLAAHPNGEPDLSLNVFLDEQNELSAEIKDPESGEHSNISINLVNRSKSEREEPANFELTDIAEKNDSTEDHGTGLLAAAEKKATAEKKTDTINEPFRFDSIESTNNSAEKSDKTDDNFFDLPDFDTLETAPVSADMKEIGKKKNEAEEKLNEVNFDIPDFDDTQKNSSITENISTDFATTSEGPDFTDLYGSKTTEDTTGNKENPEKTKRHVIICIICAAVCIIATILVLFVIPSRINLIKSIGTKEMGKTTEPVLQTPQQPLPVMPEQQVPPAAADQEVPAQTAEPPAKENEIVVPQTPEVIPTAPQPAKTQNEDIKYKIHWGDTLWDLADAYYRNPWKYQKIAKYNHIKDPDYIISGTYIIIPAQ